MNIVIAGDSWAYVWNGLGDHHPTDPNLGEILKSRGHTVQNLGVAGGSNRQSLRLLTNQIQSADCCIFIQTEPIREWWIGAGVDINNANRSILDAQAVVKLAKEHNGLVNAMNHYLKTEIYKPLDEWSREHSIPVLVVGGCSSYDSAILSGKLIPAVPSWCELLFGPDKFQDHLLVNTSQWMSHEYADLIHKQKEVELMLEWYEFTKLAMKKTTHWQNDTEYFKPDPWHPNSQGHEKLVNYLEKRFLNDLKPLTD